MNKKINILAFAVVFSVFFGVFGIHIYAQYTGTQYVYDPAYALTDSQLSELNNSAEQISEKYGCGVYFIVTDDPGVNYDNIQFYAEDVYDEMLGYGAGRDGVLLVLSVYDRCYWLTAYGDKGNYAFTDYSKEWMSENFIDNFAAGDWYGGMKDYILDCEYILEQAAEGKPVDVYYDNTNENIGVEAYGFAFLIGVAAAALICTVLKSQMKTARTAVRARAYISQEGVNILFRDNQYRFSTVTRTKIQQNNNHAGGSSRGGTTVNSRGFSGKGGRF